MGERSSSRWRLPAVLWLAWTAGVGAAPAPVPGQPDAAAAGTDPCAGFSWRVGYERQLFAAAPAVLAAATRRESAPLLSRDRLYELRLTPQEQVRFASPPAHAARDSGPRGGLARFRVARTGLYRVSLDRPFWVDLVVGSEPLHSTDFQGAAGCSAPHKIVQFMLPADTDIVLQVSGLQAPRVRLTVTAAP